MIGIKTRNFTANKTERNFVEGGGLGWAPGQERKFEGTGINTIRYGKNHSKIFGTCKKCKQFTEKKGTAGEHCSLPRDKACID